MKQRIRIGWKVPVFSNLFVAVVYVTEAQAFQAESLIKQLRSVLTIAGHQDVADRFVCERS